MGPLTELAYEARPNWIHADVGRLLFKTLVGSKSMIEKVPLPEKSTSSCGETLPAENQLSEGLLLRKRKEHMEMIGHHEKQVQMPVLDLMVVSSRADDLLGTVSLGQCLLATIAGADGQEEN